MGTTFRMVYCMVDQLKDADAICVDYLLAHIHVHFKLKMKILNKQINFGISSQEE